MLKNRRPTLMGILNVTPDSFSDGGTFMHPKDAVERALAMEAEGVDVIDIGGESSGPGSSYVPLEAELSRVIPIITEVRRHTKLPISIDTYKAAVAQEALDSGADIVNDVTALRGDEDMGRVIAKAKCQCILMYSKDSTARTTRKRSRYRDVIATIHNFFEERVDYARSQGIRKKQIVLDPGMGAFVSGLPRYSYEILARLSELQELGYPLLVGPSRKSFLGGKVDDRLERGLAASCLAYFQGATIIRTHDVLATRKALDTVYEVIHAT